MSSDMYSILNVGRHATPQEIRAAYLRLASEMHPDLNSQDAAAELRFKKIQTAYEILADPQSRAEYDRNSYRRLKRPVVHAGAPPRRTPTAATSSSTCWEPPVDANGGFDQGA